MIENIQETIVTLMFCDLLAVLLSMIFVAPFLTTKERKIKKKFLKISEDECEFQYANKLCNINSFIDAIKNYYNDKDAYIKLDVDWDDFNSVNGSMHPTFGGCRIYMTGLGIVELSEESIKLIVGHEIGHLLFGNHKPRIKFIDNWVGKVDEFAADFYAVYLSKKLDPKYYFGIHTKDMINTLWVPFHIFAWFSDHPSYLPRIIASLVFETCMLFVRKDKLAVAA